MPSQSLANVNVQGDYYQLNAEGGDGRLIYDNDADYRHFLSLLEKYILKNDSVEALAYCLAPNHFCLLLNQTGDDGVAKLMHNIMTSYNTYFYDKYAVEDLLSESDYKVSKVSGDDLLGISRQIHTQSDDWVDCEYSSIRAYFYDDAPVWLNKKLIAGLYGSAVKYAEFLKTA